MYCTFQYISNIIQYKIPVRNTGMDTKKPPTAQTRVKADFFRYLLVLKTRKKCVRTIP